MQRPVVGIIQARMGSTRLPAKILKPLGHPLWTLDEEKDYELVSRIFDAMGRVQFPWEDAAAMVLSHSEWREINRHVRQRTV